MFYKAMKCQLTCVQKHIEQIIFSEMRKAVFSW